MEYVCKQCGEKFPSPRRLGWHLRFSHDMSVEEYYNKSLKKNQNEGKCLQCGNKTKFLSMSQGYRDFCSVSCSRKYAESNITPEDQTTVTCKVCNEDIVGRNKKDAGMKLSQHVWYIHQLTSQDYYDAYVKQPNEDLCSDCGKQTRYHGILLGYEKYCPECSLKRNGGHNLGIAEVESRKHKEEVLEQQKKIQDYYKKMYADDDVIDPKEKPHDVSKGFGLLTNDAIRKEADKFYTEVDTCQYDMPIENESISMKIKRRYKDLFKEETPKMFQWIINKMR